MFWKISQTDECLDNVKKLWNKAQEDYPCWNVNAQKRREKKEITIAGLQSPTFLLHLEHIFQPKFGPRNLRRAILEYEHYRVFLNNTLSNKTLLKNTPFEKTLLTYTLAENAFSKKIRFGKYTLKNNSSLGSTRKSAAT